MSRKKNIKKREVQPDYKYQSKNVTRLIKCIMKEGRIETARNIVYKAFDLIEQKLKKNPAEIFEEVLEFSRPLMRVKSRRIGGATYLVPMEVDANVSRALFLRWVVEAVRERVLKNAVLDLSQVIVDAYNKTGYIMTKRNSIHKQAEDNKASAHYRW